MPHNLLKTRYFVTYSFLDGRDRLLPGDVIFEVSAFDHNHEGSLKDRVFDEWRKNLKTKHSTEYVAFTNFRALM